MTPGTWGSSASPATYVDDTFFTGTGTLTVTTGPPPSAYQTWTAANGLSGADALPTADVETPIPDGLDNLLEFGFGTDPKVNFTGSLVWDGTNLTPGQPIAIEYFGGVDLQFVQRTDEGTSGSVRYVVEFSSDMTDWETSDDMPTPLWYSAPTVVGSDPAVPGYELVKITFPFTLESGKKARFGRVTVIEVP